jgi:hypothetical protein
MGCCSSKEGAGVGEGHDDGSVSRGSSLRGESYVKRRGRAGSNFSDFMSSDAGSEQGSPRSRSSSVSSDAGGDGLRDGPPPASAQLQAESLFELMHPGAVEGPADAAAAANAVRAEAADPNALQPALSLPAANGYSPEPERADFGRRLTGRRFEGTRGGTSSHGSRRGSSLLPSGMPADEMGASPWSNHSGTESFRSGMSEPTDGTDEEDDAEVNLRDINRPSGSHRRTSRHGPRVARPLPRSNQGSPSLKASMFPDSVGGNFGHPNAPLART